jgi:hypothetical protein
VVSKWFCEPFPSNSGHTWSVYVSVNRLCGSTILHIVWRSNCSTIIWFMSKPGLCSGSCRDHWVCGWECRPMSGLLQLCVQWMDWKTSNSQGKAFFPTRLKIASVPTRVNKSVSSLGQAARLKISNSFDTGNNEKGCRPTAGKNLTNCCRSTAG